MKNEAIRKNPGHPFKLVIASETTGKYDIKVSVDNPNINLVYPTVTGTNDQVISSLETEPSLGEGILMYDGRDYDRDGRNNTILFTPDMITPYVPHTLVLPVSGPFVADTAFKLQILEKGSERVIVEQYSVYKGVISPGANFGQPNFRTVFQALFKDQSHHQCEHRLEGPARWLLQTGPLWTQPSNADLYWKLNDDAGDGKTVRFRTVCGTFQLVVTYTVTRRNVPSVPHEKVVVSPLSHYRLGDYTVRRDPNFSQRCTFTISNDPTDAIARWVDAPPSAAYGSAVSPVNGYSRLSTDRFYWTSQGEVDRYGIRSITAFFDKGAVGGEGDEFYLSWVLKVHDIPEGRTNNFQVKAECALGALEAVTNQKVWLFTVKGRRANTKKSNVAVLDQHFSAESMTFVLDNMNWNFVDVVTNENGNRRSIIDSSSTLISTPIWRENTKVVEGSRVVRASRALPRDRSTTLKTSTGFKMSADRSERGYVLELPTSGWQTVTISVSTAQRNVEIIFGAVFPQTDRSTFRIISMPLSPPPPRGSFPDGQIRGRIDTVPFHLTYDIYNMLFNKVDDMLTPEEELTTTTPTTTSTSTVPLLTKEDIQSFANQGKPHGRRQLPRARGETDRRWIVYYFRPWQTVVNPITFNLYGIATVTSIFFDDQMFPGPEYHLQDDQPTIVFRGDNLKLHGGALYRMYIELNQLQLFGIQLQQDTYSTRTHWLNIINSHLQLHQLAYGPDPNECTVEVGTGEIGEEQIDSSILTTSLTRAISNLDLSMRLSCSPECPSNATAIPISVLCPSRPLYTDLTLLTLPPLQKTSWFQYVTTTIDPGSSQPLLAFYVKRIPYVHPGNGKIKVEVQPKVTETAHDGPTLYLFTQSVRDPGTTLPWPDHTTDTSSWDFTPRGDDFAYGFYLLLPVPLTPQMIANGRFNTNIKLSQTGYWESDTQHVSGPIPTEKHTIDFMVMEPSMNIPGYLFESEDRIQNFLQKMDSTLQTKTGNAKMVLSMSGVMSGRGIHIDVGMGAGDDSSNTYNKDRLSWTPPLRGEMDLERGRVNIEVECVVPNRPYGWVADIEPAAGAPAFNLEGVVFEFRLYDIDTYVDVSSQRAVYMGPLNVDVLRSFIPPLEATQHDCAQQLEGPGTFSLDGSWPKRDLKEMKIGFAKSFHIAPVHASKADDVLRVTVSCAGSTALTMTWKVTGEHILSPTTVGPVLVPNPVFPALPTTLLFCSVCHESYRRNPAVLMDECKHCFAKAISRKTISIALIALIFFSL